MAEYLQIHLPPLQGQMMGCTLLVPAPSLPCRDLGLTCSKICFFSCAWLAIERDTPASMTGDAQSAKIFKNSGQKVNLLSPLVQQQIASSGPSLRSSLIMSDHTKVTTKSSRRQTAKQAGWGEQSMWADTWGSTKLGCIAD